MKSIQVHFDNPSGVIKPLHGVGNGPLHSCGFWDLSDYYRQLAVPCVRLHDQDFPNSRVIDIPQIFPDAGADPEDPANYDFERTDIFIQAVIDAGAKIVWRLGSNIEHTKKKYYAHPPKDYARWARVCIGVIKHYNQGWANGFHHDIRHWEIWNEPDLGPRWEEACPGSYTWSGTFKQYAELYVTAAKAIKAFDPSLKVGGYAAAFPKGELLPKFLAFCREHHAPLDFYSWHTYSNDPRVPAENARIVRAQLISHGYDQTESHLNEWNLKHESFFQKGFETVKKEHFERYKSEVGASYAAAVLTLLQDAGLDMANYYDTAPWSPWCGLFDIYGVPQKTYHAFRAFRSLLDYPARANAEVSDGSNDQVASIAQSAWIGPAQQSGGRMDIVTCLAAVDPLKGAGGILISKTDGHRGITRVAVDGAWITEATMVEVCLIDQSHNLEPVQLHERQRVASGKVELDLPLGEFAVALIRVNGSALA